MRSWMFRLILPVWTGLNMLPALALPEIDALWDAQRPAWSESRLRDLLEQADDAGLDYRLQLQTQIARALGLQRRYTDALNLLDQVAAHLPPEPCTARVRYQLERGRIFAQTFEFSRAMSYLQAALLQADRLKQGVYAVEAAQLLSQVAPERERLGWQLEALRLAEKSPDQQMLVLTDALYTQIGTAYQQKGEPARALEMFEKSLAWNQAHHTGEGELQAEWRIGRSLRALGEIKTALARQKALLARREKQHLAPDGQVYEEIGECLLSLGKPEQASPYFARAWELLSADAGLSRRETGRLERLRALGKR